MAYLLKEYANEEIDIAKVMLMCLIHDIVEIDAGDTYAYDAESLKTQKAREDVAKERIFSMLPEEQAREFIEIFDEFEAYEPPESKFAHAMDKRQLEGITYSNLSWRYRAKAGGKNASLQLCIKSKAIIGKYAIINRLKIPI